VACYVGVGGGGLEYTRTVLLKIVGGGKGCEYFCKPPYLFIFLFSYFYKYIFFYFFYYFLKNYYHYVKYFNHLSKRNFLKLSNIHSIIQPTIASCFTGFSSLCSLISFPIFTF
jgi:hypothetical protein